MTLFDAYLMVDWSASSEPNIGENSIWLTLLTRTEASMRVEVLENPRTRSDAYVRIRQLLENSAARGLRILVGFDFPYGYPSGFAAALDSNLEAAPWRATWDRLAAAIRDDAHNRNNRFEVASDVNAKLGPRAGPFWGCPRECETPTLRRTSCHFPHEAQHRLEQWRLSEMRLRQRKKRPHATWKLFYNGCVGSQALMGIPRVAMLRDDEALAALSRVWPFETGFTPRPTPERGPFVLHAEIWPSAVPIDRGLHEIKDAAQVLTLARHFAGLDHRVELGALFDTPQLITDSELAACTTEEGWILGA